MPRNKSVTDPDHDCPTSNAAPPSTAVETVRPLLARSNSPARKDTCVTGDLFRSPCNPNLLEKRVYFRHSDSNKHFPRIFAMVWPLTSEIRDQD